MTKTVRLYKDGEEFRYFSDEYKEMIRQGWRQAWTLSSSGLMRAIMEKE